MAHVVRAECRLPALLGYGKGRKTADARIEYQKMQRQFKILKIGRKLLHWVHVWSVKLHHKALSSTFDLRENFLTFADVSDGENHVATRFQ